MRSSTQGFGDRSRFPRALVRLSVRRPIAVLVAWLGVALCAAPGVFQLRVETSTSSILDRTSPEWEFYQSAQARFGGDEVLTLLLVAETPFEPQALADLEEIANALEGIEGIRRVDSLYTVPNIRITEEGDVSLEPMLAHGPLAADELARRLGADRIAPRILASEDGRSLALNLLLERGSEPLYRAILEAVDREMRGRAGHVSGVPVFRVSADARTRAELLAFIPLTIFLVGLLLLILFRNLRGIVTPISTTALGVWVVMGIMGFSGSSVTITTVALPSVLLALGCAYCMHFINAASCEWEPARLEGALEAVALPVMLSGLTTAVGFVAISVVPIQAIRDVGGYGALGVLVVVMSACTAVPAALRLWPLPARPPRFHEMLRSVAPARITRIAQNRRGMVAVVWLVALASMGVGLTRLHVETDVTLWFQKADPIRVSYDVIREKLVGISPVNVVVEGSEGASIVEPATIAAIADMARYLEELPSVGRAISIADLIQQLHREFTGESASIPGDSRAIQQYLLLLESKEYTRELLTLDHTAANVVLRVNDNGSAALLAVAQEAVDWWAEHGVSGVSVRPTGIMYEFARAQSAITWGQIRGLALALGAIALILVFVFRDVRLAAAALVPNAVPIVMMFGAMGLLGVPIDAATVIVGNLALGIAVDDTIHLAAGFVERRADARSGAIALEETLQQVLAPLVYTTATVAIGFLALSMSGFGPIRSLGLITAGVVTVCLLADLFLLPALLLRGDASRG